MIQVIIFHCQYFDGIYTQYTHLLLSSEAQLSNNNITFNWLEQASA